MMVPRQLYRNCACPALTSRGPRRDLPVSLIDVGHIFLTRRRLIAREWPRRLTLQEEAGSCRPRLAAVTYAAATSTLICLGLASSRSGSRTVTTPALYSALTLPASTVGGSANVRANDP